jgi:hypothetical protein
MITCYIVTASELNAIVPNGFFIEGENVDKLTFKDYAHYLQPDEKQDLYLLFIGRKVGLCYDSNITNIPAWEKYFANCISLNDTDEYDVSEIESEVII